MVYLPTGSSDLSLILSCMTENILYLSFSTLYSSSLWRTDTIAISKLNKPPPLKKSPPSLLSSPPSSNGLEINKPRKGLNRVFTVLYCYLLLIQTLIRKLNNFSPSRICYGSILSSV